VGDPVRDDIPIDPLDPVPRTNHYIGGLKPKLGYLDPVGFR